MGVWLGAWCGFLCTSVPFFSVNRDLVLHMKMFKLYSVWIIIYFPMRTCLSLYSLSKLFIMCMFLWIRTYLVRLPWREMKAGTQSLCLQTATMTECWFRISSFPIYVKMIIQIWQEKLTLGQWALLLQSVTHSAWITGFEHFWELASEERNLATVNTAFSRICSQSKPSPAPHETSQSDAYHI